MTPRPHYPLVVVARDSGGTRHHAAAAWAWAWNSSPRVADLIPKSKGTEPGDQDQTMNAAGGHLTGVGSSKSALHENRVAKANPRLISMTAMKSQGRV